LNFQEYYDKKGLSQGVFRLLYDNGKVSQIGYHKHGKMVGEWLKYFNDGSLQDVSYYDSLGFKSGKWIYYSKSKKVIKTEYYLNDQLIKKDSL
jgi:antitoxin component YwqK of YwqJK toxin-antitoxin module